MDTFPGQLTAPMKAVIQWIDDNRLVFDETARYLWDNPELGLAEFKSSARLQELLLHQGFIVEKGVAGMETAFTATRGAGKPVIGILAEFDALPGLSQQAGVTERKPLKEGAPGHGCGHNLYAASGTVAAMAIAEIMEHHGLPGTVRLFGTPAEETIIGKIYMNRDGVFHGADVMLSCHPQDVNGVDYSSSLALDNLKFRFLGKTAHAGAAPEAGRSALDGVELMNVGANYMREHVPEGVRVHYVITRGGEAPNIVPALAEVWYYLRAPGRAQADDVRAWLIDIARGAALMTQTTVEYRLLTATRELLPNRTLAQMGDRIVKLVGPPVFSPEDQRFGRAVMESMGKRAEKDAYSAEIVTPDFSRTFPDVRVARVSKDVNYTWCVPSLHFMAASMAQGTPLHSWQAACQTSTPPAMKAGLQLTKYVAAAAMECLTNPGLIAEAWKELGGYVDLYGYSEPLPPDAKVPRFDDLY